MSQDVLLVPGTLPGGTGYCFTDFQQLNVDIITQASAQLQGGAAFYNNGEDEPSPNDRQTNDGTPIPWFKPSTGYWWSYQFGGWVRPNPEAASSDARRIFVGDTTALQTYDGGDTGMLGDASGPMWEVDTVFDDRIPIGVKAIIAAVLGTAGGQNVTLAANNLPQHNHYISIDGTPHIDVPSEAGRLRVGGGTEIDWEDSTASTFAGRTRNNGTDFGGAGTPVAISLLNPVIGVYFIKRTTRGWYKM